MYQPTLAPVPRGGAPGLFILDMTIRDHRRIAAAAAGKQRKLRSVGLGLSGGFIRSSGTRRPPVSRLLNRNQPSTADVHHARTFAALLQ
jgi:hypothetical protein